MYNKQRVIDIETDSSTDSSDNVSSSSEDNAMNKQFRLAVVRGIKVDYENKDNLKHLVKTKNKTSLWNNIGTE